jgi:hypothetical protein
MYTIIAAGGSGVRVLEAMIHLFACGLGRSDAPVRILVIDTDKSNGNFARLKLLVDKYTRCAALFRGQLGKSLDGKAERNLFGTELDLLDVEGGEKGLKVWTPVLPNQNLKEAMDYSVLPEAQQTGQNGGRALTSKDVLRLLYTENELEEKLESGFRGHPSIGAAALSLISRHQTEQPWAKLIDLIRQDVGQATGSRVGLIGSVFGGTGAAALHPIARFLRTIPHANPDRLKIAVAALVPYFQFSDTPIEGETREQKQERARLAAQAKWFSLATRAAADYYDYLRGRNAAQQQRDGNYQWPFDALFWVGDSGRMQIPEGGVDAGGPTQRNPAHFVEILAALSLLEFFAGAEAELPSGGACLYSGPRQDVVPPPEERNLVDWADLPLFQRKRDEVQKAMLRFALVGAVHLRFGLPLMQDSRHDTRSQCVPWFHDRFKAHHQRLDTEAEMAKLELLRDFYRVCHFPWWSQVLSLDASSEVRLFNKAGFVPSDRGEAADVSLDYLNNLLWRGDAGKDRGDDMDYFLTDMVKIPKRAGVTGGANAYVSLLALAADRFIAREYSRKGEQEG